MIARYASMLSAGVALAPLGLGMGLGLSRRKTGGAAGGIPSNALTLNGEALTLNGQYITLGG